MFKPLHMACVSVFIFAFNASFSLAQDSVRNGMPHEDKLIVNNTLTLHQLIESALPPKNESWKRVNYKQPAYCLQHQA
jgi:hypothetical protein